MKKLVIPALFVGLWLIAWATDTGVLVWSSVDKYQYAGDVRTCQYFIGLSIQRVERGDSWRFSRCPLLMTIR